jgi:hypothetical protein
MSDNVAVLEGYTKEVWGRYVRPCGMQTLVSGDYTKKQRPFLVKPGTDFTDHFRAWDMDSQEFMSLIGSCWDISDKETEDYVGHLKELREKLLAEVQAELPPGEESYYLCQGVSFVSSIKYVEPNGNLSYTNHAHAGVSLQPFDVDSMPIESLAELLPLLKQEKLKHLERAGRQVTRTPS